MGYLALTVICYKDSGGGAIWKAGDQYPPTKDSCSELSYLGTFKNGPNAAYDKAFESY